MLLSSEVIQINNEPHILTFQNNITQRKQTEAQLQHHQLQMDSLRKVDSAIISSIDLNLTLPMILEQVAARWKWTRQIFFCTTLTHTPVEICGRTRFSDRAF